MLYVGGRFTHAGPIPASHVAAWSSTEGWRAFGEGVPRPVVAMAVGPDGAVYVVSRDELVGASADVFRFADGVWSTLAEDAPVAVLAIDTDGALLAGGWFREIGGVSAPDGFARWDGTGWSALAQPGSEVGAIRVDDVGLCVGGGITNGFVACRAHGATRWDRMAIPLQPGPPYREPVNSIERDEAGRIIAAGGVYLGERQTHGGVIRFDGGTWDLLGQGLGLWWTFGLQLEVFDLARSEDGSLYAVGMFDSIGESGTAPSRADGVARWVDERWEAVGELWGGDYPAFAAARGGPHIYVGGDMLGAYDSLAPGGAHAVAAIARVADSRWSALTHPGTPAHGPRTVRAIAARGGCAPYIAGSFDVVEDADVFAVGRREADGVIGAFTENRLRGVPSVMAIGLDGTLYAGGYRLEAWTRQPRPLAWVQDGYWQPFGRLEESDAVTSLVVDESGLLYVGGYAPDHRAPGGGHLLSWDGVSWNRLVRIDEAGAITAMLLHDGTLYVAERVAGSGSRLARLDGSVLVPLGAGLEGEVRTLAAYHGDIVAGGQNLVGGSQVARFDGSSWTALEPFDGYMEIHALAIVGDALVAGGGDAVRFTGVLARHTASGWEDLVGGVDGAVYSLAVTPEGLLVGGTFEVAGGTTPSSGLALLTPP